MISLRWYYARFVPFLHSATCLNFLHFLNSVHSLICEVCKMCERPSGFLLFGVFGHMCGSIRSAIANTGTFGLSDFVEAAVSNYAFLSLCSCLFLCSQCGQFNKISDQQVIICGQGKKNSSYPCKPFFRHSLLKINLGLD